MELFRLIVHTRLNPVNFIPNGIHYRLMVDVRVALSPFVLRAIGRVQSRHGVKIEWSAHMHASFFVLKTTVRYRGF